MTAGPGQVQSGMHVQPGPLSSAVGEALAADGKKYVILQVEHTTGTSVFALDPAHAEKLGADLTAQALRSKSGLVVPAPGSLLGPLNPPAPKG